MNRLSQKVLAALLLITISASAPGKADPIDHSVFDALLKQYVNERGEVDYAAVKKDGRLPAYLEHLSTIDPGTLAEREAIAFWINAYNAYTIKLIVDNYPVGSIKEITPIRIKGISLAIPKINSPFEYKIAEINGKKYSLDDIEHSILRARFDEPRIHFALVCASVSCPPLRREAYTGSRLDEQLDAQARRFLHDAGKNKIDVSDSSIYLSRIFKWFASDFTKKGNTIQEYLAPYFEDAARVKLAAGGFEVEYLKYDWSLNGVGSFNN